MRELVERTGNPCQDCGQHTCPCVDPGEIYIVDGCYQTVRRPIIEDGTWEWYVLRPEIWWQAVGVQEDLYGGGGFLCIGCLEGRLGRPVVPSDFDWTVPANERSPLSTERLLRAQGHLP